MSIIAKKKILVVEDVLATAEMLKMKLEENDYQVIIAHDGDEGLQKAYKEKPDLLILDLMLPQLNGYMLCSLLKKNKRYATVPIIIVTARSKEEDRKLGEKMGADAYITKPFKPEVILDKVKELLQE